MTSPPTICPTCGELLPPRHRRCYRCKPAIGRGHDVPTAAARSLVAKAAKDREAEMAADPLRSDQADEARANFARLATEERERTTEERRVKAKQLRMEN